MVTNGMSVRSSSGSLGLAAASSAAASTSAGNSCGTSCSRSIAAMPAVKVAPSWSCRLMLRRGTVAAFLSRVGT